MRGLAGAFGLALLVGACGDGSGDAARAAREGGQVVIAEGQDLQYALPLIEGSVMDSYVMDMVFRPMLDSRWEDGELHYLTSDEGPRALTKRLEYFGPDSASIRYHMRGDLLWSDGVSVTAHDAKFTFDLRGLPELASPRQDMGREIREVVVENDSTLVIHFNRRYAEMLYHTAQQIIPRHVYEDADPAQLRSHPSVTGPVEGLVTNGPMRLVEWVRGQRIVLERDTTFEPRVQIERVVFRIIPEETTRIVELQTGNVDVAELPFTYVDQVRDADHLRIETQEGRSYEYIGYNPNAHEFFADPEIRRALTMAIDRDALIAALQIDEFARVAGGPYSHIFRLLYDPEGQAPLPYDTAEANRILDSKGWVVGANGVRAKDGQPLAFTLATNGNNQRRVDIAQVVENQWARIGVDANIQTLEFNTFYDRAENKDFEALIAGWSVALSPDLYQTWGDPSLRFNFVSYDNPRVQELMAAALEQPTPEAAAAYWQQAATAITADQPYTWLFYYDQAYGVNERVQGIDIDTLSPYQRVWEWYIEP